MSNEITQMAKSEAAAVGLHLDLPHGSSLSYLSEVNEVNVEPSSLGPGSTQVSDPTPLASASLSEAQRLASPKAQLSQTERSAEHRQKANEADAGQPPNLSQTTNSFDPRHGVESAVEHIRLQLWDRRPVRGTPFRAKVEIRLPNRVLTRFINFTEGRKWFAKRQDGDLDSQHWYEWYRQAVTEFEQGYDGEPDYRPRIGHMILRPEYGKKERQMPQASGILTWEKGQPSIILMIHEFAWPLPMRRSKHDPGPKTPGWYAYWQPRHEDQDCEEDL